MKGVRPSKARRYAVESQDISLARYPAGGEQEATVKITRTDNGDETVVAIEGSLDAKTARDLQPVNLGIAKDGRKGITFGLFRSCSDPWPRAWLQSKPSRLADQN